MKPQFQEILRLSEENVGECQRCLLVLHSVSRLSVSSDIGGLISSFASAESEAVSLKLISESEESIAN